MVELQRVGKIEGIIKLSPIIVKTFRHSTTVNFMVRVCRKVRESPQEAANVCAKKKKIPQQIIRQ